MANDALRRPAAAAADSAPPPPARVIPVLDLVGADNVAAALMDDESGRLDALIALARRHYGGPMIRLADRLSRRWLARNKTPYAGEIAAVARRLAIPGGYFLNLSFEWSCTCGVAPDPAGEGMRLLRVLDWPLEGLGESLVAVRQAGSAGEFLNLGWPGFVGVATALAPGRFAAALNQAPMARHGLGRIGDWALNRLQVWRSRALPPMHLLRRVFEEAPDYRAARARLAETPIAIPAIFTLAGPRPGEGCVIERTAHRAFLHEAPVCVANHWLTPALEGRARGIESAARQALMETVYRRPTDGFAWLAPPVLNPTTRLVAEMNPATGRLAARGFEADGPATRVLRLPA